MNYYCYVENEKIIGCGCAIGCSDNTKNIPISADLFNACAGDRDKIAYIDNKIVLNPNYEEIKKQRERERIDSLTLTPADVERALYKAKGMDFEDLKALIQEKAPQLDMKALAIEFRSNNFYRGAEVKGIRIIDTIGAILGYTSDDMDYLFEHKELPINE